ncbi:hypothetical protein DFH08DRAFT_275136 [Mycena albidolilacea]|uniref:F-box domain-containing protein n=1 Tax=Mycena albidolilacea TaxID=1033008 RepID=A0AAD7APK0_9AGAR|nr:hypothetical protein DFH08DRAFT_275136 [Mycena albidolilacea]
MDDALNLQDGSLFIQLPPEMRVEIYSHLFFSTRVTWGSNIYSLTGQRTVPAPNALALLRTCRQVHLEIGRTWLHQILFSFESAQEMLEKLTDIPPATRALIRHVRVSGDPLMLLDEDDEGVVCYCLSQVFTILPGLALDRLTILGPYRDPEECCEMLDMLVRHGAGWKELYFLAHDSTFLAYKHHLFSFPGGADEERFLRVPQPAGWQRALDERDGDGASVEIYRATSSHPCSVLLQPATRARFAQALPPGKTLKTFSKEVDAFLMVPGEREKEVLVVVRRGKAVDYVQKEDMLCLEEGHLRLLREWKAACYSTEARTEQVHADIGERRSLMDHYTHVDEYRWQTAWTVPPDRTYCY